MKGSTIYSISRLELSLALAVVGPRQGVKYSELLILSQVEWGGQDFIILRESTDLGWGRT